MMDRSSIAREVANFLVVMCQPIEDSILLDTAYRKRIRKPPVEVSENAIVRFLQLLDSAGYDVPDDVQVVQWSYLNLADLLWNRMSEQEQYQWLLKTT